MDRDELAGLRVAIYARYSSENQREASITDQVARCREFIETHGGSVPSGLVFADEAVSGSSMDRPAFARLSVLATSTPAGVDAIVAEDLSRIGRSEADLHVFRRACEYSNVRLIGVGDGIDTASAQGHLAFSLKSMISESYLRDLSDKTRRGLLGRARAGYATGGVAFGYRLEKETDSRGKLVGSKILIDSDKAKVVQRIFALYLEGNSLATIARLLNVEKVPPPRVHVAGRRVGWKDSTVRAMLHNESYTGKWSYKKRQWRKLPGTNKRRPTPRPAEQVFSEEFAERRIIDPDTWDAVQSRLLAVRTHFSRTKDGKPKGRSIPGRATPYLFSGLLWCGACQGKMVISGGSGVVRYRCESHSKRGTCANALSVREDVLRKSILDELRHRLVNSGGLEYARKEMAKRLGTLGREQNSGIAERSKKIAHITEQVERLVDALASGTASKSVRERLSRLERELDGEKRSLATLRRQAAVPVLLPTAKEVLSVVFDLEARLTQNIVAGREELRRLFQDGRIDLIPKAEGFYVARSKLLPLILLVQPPSEASQGGRYTAVGCAGRI